MFGVNLVKMGSFDYKPELATGILTLSTNDFFELSVPQNGVLYDNYSVSM